MGEVGGVGGSCVGMGGVGLFSVAGGCGGLNEMQWEGNGQETDEIT